MAKKGERERKGIPSVIKAVSKRFKTKNALKKKKQTRGEGQNMLKPQHRKKKSE